MKVIYVIVPTIQNTRTESPLQIPNWLMLFMNVIVVYLKNTETRNKNVWQEVEFLHLTAEGKYNKWHNVTIFPG